MIGSVIKKAAYYYTNIERTLNTFIHMSLFSEFNNGPYTNTRYLLKRIVFFGLFR